MARKKMSILVQKSNILDGRNNSRRILRDMFTSQTKKVVEIKPLKTIDVVHVYTSSDLDELIGTPRKASQYKTNSTKERAIRKRRFVNFVLGITTTDLIEIAQQNSVQ